MIKTSTWIIALILGLLGILLYLADYMNWFAGFAFWGFVLLLIGWLLMIIAVRTKGL